MTTTIYAIIISLFFAFFTFGLIGFGSGLIAMALLTPVLGVTTAAPMFALISIGAECMMFVRYRQHIQLQSVWRLALTSLIAIPIGILIVPRLNEHLVLIILGLVIAGYGAYSLFTPHLPQITNKRWGFIFGFISGLLTGAYNSGGPPLVIYGNLARWQPNEYKSNLPGMFMLNSVFVITTHALAGHYSQHVLENVIIGLPVMLIGLFVGWSLDKRINPEMFRKLVLFLLVVIGVRLILGNLT
jgi:uncharacterized membrane protein YfcA